MAKNIKFRHFGPFNRDTGETPELPGLSAKELADRAKKEIGTLRREAAAGWRANTGPAGVTGECWAAWAIRSRFGFEPPEDMAIRIGSDHMAQFCDKLNVGSYVAPEYEWGDPIGPAVFVPEHCRTVTRADLWHLIHQAGGSADLRATAANPYGRLEPELKAVLEPVTGLSPAEALAVMLARPAALMAACEAVVTRRAAERIASDARYRAHRIAEFPEIESRELAKDSGDGSGLAGRGAGFWPRASAAQWRRNEWWGLAKAAREFGLTEARDRCVARARLFHRLFLQFRTAEAAQAIVDEAARIAALPPPPTKAEKRAIAAARKADKEARSAAFQAKKAEREAQRAKWRAMCARWSYQSQTVQAAA